MKARCVKVEMLAECDAKGNITKSGWTEYYSPLYHHPYNVNKFSFIGECGGDQDLALLNASVGQNECWLNDDLSYLSDRMTVGLDGDWNKCKDAFEDGVNAALENGEVRLFTICSEGERFGTYLVTPLERIPDYVRLTTPETKGDAAWADYNGEIPERVHAIHANAIRKANGDEELPLPPKPLKTFKIRYRRSDEGFVDVCAESAEEAMAKAKVMTEKDGVWLQSDPDRQYNDWEFEVYD